MRLIRTAAPTITHATAEVSAIAGHRRRDAGRGTGLDAVLRNICNRLGGFEPDVRHRTDDGLLLSALVASGRAVALLPALFTAEMPHLIARRVREERFQRTIFTATRHTTSRAPAVVAVRDALRDAARRVAAGERTLEVLD